jgi:predicted adenine nucleotide alpha hydrolase (AANH) superfamily ATPase
MKVALHICCAVCAAGAAERLLQEGHQVQGFFYNPNIFPPDEYQRRLEAARLVARKLGFALIEGDYRPGEWDQAVSSLETEPEGGKRCPVCFRMRLERTFRFMLENGCQAFTTTLTMGSNKSSQVMTGLGEEIGGLQFLSRDFKKKEGFKRASLLAREWGLYRQHYCGCKYTLPRSDST